MKPLVGTTAARLAGLLTAVATSASLPAFCQQADEANARGMFREQMNKPQERLNNGFAYWIELERNGEKSRVSNKEAFVANDRIRFHFKPNFDGYAYIYYVEKEGNGDKALLFPAADAPDNKISAGKEITLPFSKDFPAWLKFDDSQGTEVVRIIVSRDKLTDKSQAQGSKDVKPDVAVTSDPKHAGKIAEHAYVSMEPLGGMVLGERRLSLDVVKAPEQKGEVTVVSTEIEKPLSVDISLTHKK
ncbi:MAG TPA: DUF4384 domain-containing protein [Oculatellaceae cyanobacterium]